jgi:hypothetical protein
MSSHGTSTEEEFEVIKFVENNAPFSLLLVKPSIEKVQNLKKRRRSPRTEKTRIKRFHDSKNITLDRRIGENIKVVQNQKLGC